jgi:hypothetical protein
MEEHFSCACGESRSLPAGCVANCRQPNQSNSTNQTAAAAAPLEDIGCWCCCSRMNVCAARNTLLATTMTWGDIFWAGGHSAMDGTIHNKIWTCWYRDCCHCHFRSRDKLRLIWQWTHIIFFVKTFHCSEAIQKLVELFDNSHPYIWLNVLRIRKNAYIPNTMF